MNTKIKRKTLTLSGLALAAALLFPSQAMAEEAPDIAAFNVAAEKALAEKLANAADKQALLVEFDSVDISATAEIVKSYNDDAAAYAEDILSAYQADASQDVAVEPLAAQNYTSSVFAGVPAGGACWIKQDFRASVANCKVTSKSLLGSSYQTGVCAFQWSPNYSYFSGSFNVYSKGTFHAVIKGGPVSFASTFKAIYKVQKSSLKQNTQ